MLKTATHAFEIIGTPRDPGEARRAGGRTPYEVASDFPPLVLSQFPTPTELEIYLVGHVVQMRPAQVAAPDRPPRAGPPSPGGRRGAGRHGAAPQRAHARRHLAGLRRRLDPRPQRADRADPGVRARQRPLPLRRHAGDGDPLQGAAHRAERRRLVRASSSSPAFPGTRKVVAAALGIDPGTRPPTSLRTSAARLPGGPVDVPHHLMPRPGEVWVMNVVIEESGGDEVRYVVVDIDGRPYGAARVLKRADFEAVFTQERGGWRLLVQIDQVAEGNVLYRQLDSQRQAMGAPRKMAGRSSSRTSSPRPRPTDGRLRSHGAGARRPDRSPVTR